MERLKELRRERVLSLRALGDRSGVAYDTINKLELGRSPAHASLWLRPDTGAKGE